MPPQSVDEVERFLKANKTGVPKGARVLLESFIHLARGAGTARLKAIDLRRDLQLREGRVVYAAGLRQRLKRANNLLSRRHATFELKSSAGDVVAQPNGVLDARRDEEELQDKLTGMSNELARVDADGIVEPFASRERDILWVFFSYAWLNEEEHKIQDEFFHRLEEKLAYPPAQFAHLPRIVLWRDTRNLAKSTTGDQQLDDACDRAFLGVLLVSNKYPHSQACVREADFFVTANGDNCPGKSCIVVGVNILPSQMPARFTAKTRIAQLGPKGEHLISLWASGNTADRTQFVDQLANQVFIAANDFIRIPPLQKKKDAERFFAAFRPTANSREVIESFARPGNVSPKIVSTGALDDVKEGVPIVKHLIDWASATTGDAPRLIAILGEFGMGKTVTCQLFTQKLLELRLDNPDLPLPVYFDLREVDRVGEDGSADLETLIGQMLRKAGEEAPRAREVIKFIRERGAIVVFDGLDEITNKLSYDAAIKLYRELLGIVPSELWVRDTAQRRMSRHTRRSKRDFDGPRIVVSCRTHYFRDVAAQRGFLTGTERSKLEADADIAAYFMLPFNDQQIEKYLELQLGREQANRVISLIKDTYNLRELAERPILLRFIRETFEQIEREKLAGRTINLTRLYDIFVDRIFERDNPKHFIPTHEKQRILQALALHLHRRNQTEIGNDKLEEWFQDFITTSPRLAAALQGADGLKLSEIFAQDLRNASFLVRPGEKAFRFAHTSIREHFLATGLYSAVCSGEGERIWNVPPPSAETIDFLLQRHAIEESPERRDFEKGFVTLLEPERSVAVRRLAFEVWLAAHKRGAPLARPTVLGLSNLDLRLHVFAGVPGQLLPLQHSVWKETQLHQTEFRHADLTGADFSDSEAPMTRWINCQLRSAVFGHANLIGAQWRKCNIPRAALNEAKLHAARATSCRQGDTTWRPQPKIPVDATNWRARSRSFATHYSLAVGKADGKNVIVSGGYDKAIRVFDLASGSQVALLEGHQNIVRNVVVAPLDGQNVVVSGGYDETIRVFDLASGTQLAVLEGQPVNSIAVASLGEKSVIVTGGDDGVIRVLDPSSGAQLALLKGHQDGVSCVAVASLGELDVVVSGGLDKMIRVFNPSTGEQLAVLEGHQDSVSCIAVASLDERKVVVSGGLDKMIRVFDLATGEQLAVLEGHQGAVTSLAVASLEGATVVVSGAVDRTIRVFDLVNGAQLSTLEGHQGSIHTVLVTQLDGRNVVVSGDDKNTIRLFDLLGRTQLAVLGGYNDVVSCVAVASLDGRDVVAVGSFDHNIRVVDLTTGTPLTLLKGHQGALTSLAVTSLGAKTVVVSGSTDKTIRVFDLASGAQMTTLEGHQDAVRSIAISLLDEKKVIVSGGDDKIIRVFDLVSGAQLATLGGCSASILAVATASLNGREVVATGCDDGTVRVFDLSSGAQLSALEGHEAAVRSVALTSLDGKMVVVSVSTDKTIRIFDIASGKELAVLKGHQKTIDVVSVALVGGRSVIVSGGRDDTIQMFDLASGAQLSKLDDHQDWVTSVAVASLHGQGVIVSGGYDGTMRICIFNPQTFDFVSKLYVVPTTGSTLRLVPDGDRGDLVSFASPDAWRDWAASYDAGGVGYMTDIDDMPVSAN